MSLTCQEGRCTFRCSNDVQNPDDIDISQVFTRFYKADAARNYTSTGLGLSIAKGLTDKLGGELTAELRGCDFSVQLSLPLL